MTVARKKCDKNGNCGVFKAKTISAKRKLKGMKK